MADSHRPPPSWGLDDPGPGEALATVPDEPAHEWTFDDATDEWRFEDTTDEWTEPMTRVGTDPFHTPVRPAREQPHERPGVFADRRGRRRAHGARRVAADGPGASGATGATVGAVATVGGLVTAVAVAASLALVLDVPREPQREPREPRQFPISELAEPAGFSPLAPTALPAAEPEPTLCELDPLAPAPELPAAEPPTAPTPPEHDATAAGDDAAPALDEPERSDRVVGGPMRGVAEGDGGVGDDASDPPAPESQTPVP